MSSDMRRALSNLTAATSAALVLCTPVVAHEFGNGGGNAQGGFNNPHFGGVGNGLGNFGNGGGNGGNSGNGFGNFGNSGGNGAGLGGGLGGGMGDHGTGNLSNVLNIMNNSAGTSGNSQSFTSSQLSQIMNSVGGGNGIANGVGNGGMPPGLMNSGGMPQGLGNAIAGVSGLGNVLGGGGSTPAGFNAFNNSGGAPAISGLLNGTGGGAGGGLPAGLSNNFNSGGGLPPGLSNNFSSGGGLPPGLTNNFSCGGWAGTPAPGFASSSGTSTCTVNGNWANSGILPPALNTGSTKTFLRSCRGQGTNHAVSYPSDNHDHGPGGGDDVAGRGDWHSGIVWGYAPHTGRKGRGGGGEDGHHDHSGGGGGSTGGGGGSTGGGGGSTGGGGGSTGGGGGSTGGGSTPPGVSTGGSNPGSGGIVFPVLTANIQNTILDNTLGTHEFTNSPSASGGQLSVMLPTDITRWRTLDADPPEALALIRLQPGQPGITVPWTIASYHAQAYAFAGDDTTVILAAPGTIFGAEANHTIIVREGSVVVISGDKQARIVTPLGIAVVPVNSTSGLTVTHFGSLQVASLEGNQTAINLAYRGKERTIQVAANQEASIGINQIATAGASDYADSPDSAKSPVPGLALNNSSVDYTQSPYWPRIACVDPSALGPQMTARLAQVKRAIHKGGKPLPDTCRDSNVIVIPSIHIRTVALVSPAITGMPATAASIERLDTACATIHYLGQTPTIEGNRISARSTHMFIQADKDVAVAAGACRIVLARGAVATIDTNNGIVKLRNLCDNSRHSVVLAAGKEKVDLLPGQEAVFAVDETQANHSMRTDGVARRRIKMMSVPGGALATAEYSIVSLLEGDSMARYVIRQACDSSLRDRVLKMAACLYTATASRGAYERIGGR